MFVCDFYNISLTAVLLGGASERILNSGISQKSYNPLRSHAEFISASVNKILSSPEWQKKIFNFPNANISTDIGSRQRIFVTLFYILKSANKDY